MASLGPLKRRSNHHERVGEGRYFVKEVVEFEKGSPSRVVRVKIARQRNHLVPPAICKSVDYWPVGRAPPFELVRMRSNEI